MFDKIRRRGFALDPSCELWMPVYRYGIEQTKWWDYSGHDRQGTIVGAIPNPGISLIVPQSNMKISAVANLAFVDFGITGIFNQPGRRIVIKSNTTGAQITGFEGAAGTAETLSGTELVANNTWNANTTGWSSGRGTIASSHPAGGGQSDDYLILTSDGTAGGVYAYRASTATVGMLVKESLYIKSGSAGAKLGLAYLNDTTGNYPTGTTTDSWVQKVGYQTNTVLNANAFVQSQNNITNGQTTFVDELSMQQVLTPSATGCVITSTRGGAIQSWESQNATFNYNDAAGYTVYFEGESPGGWYFDGVDDRVVHPSINMGKLHTLHYWIKRIGDASGMVHADAVDYNGLRISDTTVGYSAGVGTAAAETHNGAASTAIKTLISIIRVLDKVNFYQDGVQIGVEQTMGGQPGDLTLTNIGRYADGTSYFNGIIYEIVCFNDNKGFIGVRNYFEMTRAIQGV